ncbi:MAG: hypothetical protein OHK93_005026 [Ramalina farinacea]|uniref:Fork-head domain-containing protein n=1 Tax=Ramalina farinacea TaxID=258253 RepID=A0AA43QYI8_9LECA|nr:hypothetical protein [Ramalina farinacea]
MSVEGHRMLLKDIYQWIADNTDKGTDPDYALWQNSVRVYLSNNPPKTRYRDKKDKPKPSSAHYKANKSDVQDILRQRHRSGRHGGQAAGRRALREVLQRHDRDPQHHHHCSASTSTAASLYFSPSPNCAPPLQSYEPAPLSALDEGERDGLVRNWNTTGFYESYIHSGSLVAGGAEGYNGPTTPMSSFSPFNGGG